MERVNMTRVNNHATRFRRQRLLASINKPNPARADARRLPCRTSSGMTFSIRIKRDLSVGRMAENKFTSPTNAVKRAMEWTPHASTRGLILLMKLIRVILVSLKDHPGSTSTNFYGKIGSPVPRIDLAHTGKK